MTLYKANATIKTRKHQPINHSQQKGGTKNIMNELKLEFQLETTELPAELDKVLLSFLKAAVEKYSPALFEKLYNKTSSVMKTYCLSMYLPGFFRNYPFLDFPTYLSFASNNCFLQRPYIVRFIIFNRLFVPSTKPLL